MKDTILALLAGGILAAGILASVQLHEAKQQLVEINWELTEVRRKMTPEKGDGQKPPDRHIQDRREEAFPQANELDVGILMRGLAEPNNDARLWDVIWHQEGDFYYWEPVSNKGKMFLKRCIAKPDGTVVFNERNDMEMRTAAVLSGLRFHQDMQRNR